MKSIHSAAIALLFVPALLSAKPPETPHSKPAPPVTRAAPLDFLGIQLGKQVSIAECPSQLFPDMHYREPIPNYYNAQIALNPQGDALSAFVRGQMGVRVTGVPETRGVDLGVNLGARGQVLPSLAVGGRLDVLFDATRGRGQAILGPEVNYIQQSWPCGRCSVEIGASYLLGFF